MLEIKDIRMDLGNYNFTEGRSAVEKFMSLEELLELTQNLYADISYYEERIEELENERYDLQEEINYLKRDIEDNYRRIPLNEQYGVSDSDFV